jgi:hypothetical protein
MRNDLKTAIGRALGSEGKRELSIARNLLETYVVSDPNPGLNDRALLESGFSGSKQLSEQGLGHRGRRAYELFKLFSFSEGSLFSELGEFALAADEPLPELQQ